MFSFLFIATLSVKEENIKFVDNLANEINSVIKKTSEKHPEQLPIVDNVTKTIENALAESVQEVSNELKNQTKAAVHVCNNILRIAKRTSVQGLEDLNNQVEILVRDTGLDKLASIFLSAYGKEEKESLTPKIPKEELKEGIKILNNVTRTSRKLLKRSFRRFSRNIKRSLSGKKYSISKSKDNTLMKKEDLIPETVVALDKIFRNSYSILYNKTGVAIEKAFKQINIKDDNGEEASKYEKVDISESIGQLKKELKKAAKVVPKMLKKQSDKIDQSLNKMLSDTINKEIDRNSENDDDVDSVLSDKKFKLKEIKEEGKNIKKHLKMARKQIKEVLKEAAKDYTLKD